MKYRSFKLKYVALLIISLAISRLQAQSERGKLRAAVVEIDITPDKPKMLLGYAARQSEGVHDPIHHKILVLDNGDIKLCWVVSDVCLVSPSEYDRVAQMLQSKLGIKPIQFWWSATHTHSAPEVGVPGLPEVFMGDRYKHDVDTSYTEFVEQTLIRGVGEAILKLQPVRLGVGWGYSEANINRRTWGLDNKATFGMTPDAAVDQRIGLLRLEKEDGTLMTLVANYPIHGTVLGPQNLKISGDVHGTVARYVKDKLGAPMLFFNGAAGNMAPVYSVYPDPEKGHLSQFNVLLGDKIIQANSNIYDFFDSVKLYAGEIIVQTPRKESLTKWPADLTKYTSKAADKKTNLVNLPIRFFRLDDNIIIWSAPLELLCEISNNIRDASPYPYTFYFGYTNGWLGYFPTAAAWQHGGYEVHTVSPFDIGGEKDLTTAVVNYLKSDEITTVSQKEVNKRKRKKK